MLPYIRQYPISRRNKLHIRSPDRVRHGMAPQLNGRDLIVEGKQADGPMQRAEGLEFKAAGNGVGVEDVGAGEVYFWLWGLRWGCGGGG